ncbi:hypothetical protein BDV32DRAFT_1735 [Aspergillus pseudonomiae]|nr:hypothetical protein BDV32DRAFT_1735 [Aspergillus pseudonomiae]
MFCSFSMRLKVENIRPSAAVPLSLLSYPDTSRWFMEKTIVLTLPLAIFLSTVYNVIMEFITINCLLYLRYDYALFRFVDLSSPVSYLNVISLPVYSILPPHIHRLALLPRSFIDRGY